MKYQKPSLTNESFNFIKYHNHSFDRCRLRCWTEEISFAFFCRPGHCFGNAIQHCTLSDECWIHGSVSPSILGLPDSPLHVPPKSLRAKPEKLGKAVRLKSGSLTAGESFGESQIRCHQLCLTSWSFFIFTFPAAWRRPVPSPSRQRAMLEWHSLEINSPSPFR